MAACKEVLEGQIPISCQLCEVEHKIKYKCIDCDLLMCGNCRDKIHPKFKNSKDHRVIDIKDVGNYTNIDNTGLDFSYIKCKDHEMLAYCLYCEVCKQLVCPSCIAKTHTKHELIEINQKYDTMLVTLQEEKFKIQNDIGNLSIEEENLSKMKSTEISKYNEAKQNILAQEKALKNAVEKYTKKLGKEIDDKWVTITKSIEGKQSNVKDTITKLSEMDQKTENLIQTKDATKFFEEIINFEKSRIIPSENEHIASMPKFIPGEITESNFGSLITDPQQNEDKIATPSLYNQVPKIDITVSKEYFVNLPIVSFLSTCQNDALWIADMQTLRKLKPDKKGLRVLSSFQTNCYGMTVLPSNDILFSTGEPVLKQIIGNSNIITDSKYSVAPLHPTMIHVTKEGKVIVAAGTKGEAFSKGRRTIVVLSKKGKQEVIHEFSKKMKPLFTHPAGITSTSEGYICVIDRSSPEGKGRLVILGHDGGIKETYKGNPKINSKETPFSPSGLVTTSLNNIIAADMNDLLHILSSTGQLLTHYKTKEVGIVFPYSLSFTTNGQLYIGCTKPFLDPTFCKLYKVDICGC